MVKWCKNGGQHWSFKVRNTPETSYNYISGCISEIDIFSEFTLCLAVKYVWMDKTLIELMNLYLQSFIAYQPRTNNQTRYKMDEKSYICHA